MASWIQLKPTFSVGDPPGLVLLIGNSPVLRGSVSFFAERKYHLAKLRISISSIRSSKITDNASVICIFNDKLYVDISD